MMEITELKNFTENFKYKSEQIEKIDVINSYHGKILSDLLFIRYSFDAFDGYTLEEAQAYIGRFIRAARSYFYDYSNSCEINEFDSGSPSWFWCRINTLYRRYHENESAYTAFEIRSLLQEHLDHDEFRKIRLSIMASINTNERDILNIVEMETVKGIKKTARTGKDIYAAVIAIREIKRRIDYGDFDISPRSPERIFGVRSWFLVTSIRNFLDEVNELARVKTTDYDIQRYVNIAKEYKSNEQFVKSFKEEFNPAKLRSIVAKTKRISKIEMSKTLDDDTENAKKIMNKLLDEVVQPARESLKILGIESSRPLPTRKRMSPGADLAIRKRQKTATLEIMRIGIKEKRSRLDALIRDLDALRRDVEEREAQALQVEKEIHEMG